VCVNGLFGVAKGDAIRLIIDCRPVNALLVPSPHVALPTPDLITKFHVPLDQPLFAAKVDLSDYYHRIKMPAAWHPYFALPAVRLNHLANSYPAQGDHYHSHHPLTNSSHAPSYVRPLSAPSHRLQQRVYTAAARYSRSIINNSNAINGNAKSGDRHSNRGLSSHLSSESFDSIDRLTSHIPAMNSYTSPPPAKLIIAANVSLPQVAGTANLLDIVPAALAATYAHPSSLHRPIHEVKPARKAFLCAPDQYRLLLKRMHQGGIIYHYTRVCQWPLWRCQR